MQRSNACSGAQKKKGGIRPWRVAAFLVIALCYRIALSLYRRKTAFGPGAIALHYYHIEEGRHPALARRGASGYCAAWHYHDTGPVLLRCSVTLRCIVILRCSVLLRCIAAQQHNATRRQAATRNGRITVVQARRPGPARSVVRDERYGTREAIELLEAIELFWS